MTLRELADRARNEEAPSDYARAVVMLDEVLTAISCSSVRAIVTPARIRRDLERKL